MDRCDALAAVTAVVDDVLEGVHAEGNAAETEAGAETESPGAGEDVSRFFLRFGQRKMGLLCGVTVLVGDLGHLPGTASGTVNWTGCYPQAGNWGGRLVALAREWLLLASLLLLGEVRVLMMHVWLRHIVLRLRRVSSDESVRVC